MILNVGSVTPIFLLMDYFLYQFSTLSEKIKKILFIRSLIYLEQAPSNSIIFSCLSVQQFKMPLEGLSFVKTLATFSLPPPM